MITRLNKTHCLLAAVLSLSLTACQESAEQTADDVADASRERAQAVADAQRDFSKAIAKSDAEMRDAAADGAHAIRETAIDPDADAEQLAEVSDEAQQTLDQVSGEALARNAKAAFDLTVAEVEGNYRVAMERCEGLYVAYQRERCESKALMQRKQALARAKADLKIAQVEAEHLQG